MMELLKMSIMPKMPRKLEARGERLKVRGERRRVPDKYAESKTNEE